MVAIIDSGVDLEHPDIQANLWINRGEIPGNGIDDDGNGACGTTCMHAYKEITCGVVCGEWFLSVQIMALGSGRHEDPAVASTGTRMGGCV